MFPSDTKVLVVDDLKTTRILLKKHLVDLGLTQITEASDGGEAWQAIEAAMAGKAFGLVISDWNMPETKGIDLLKKLRATPEMRQTPFIMVTAENELEPVKEAIEAGVTSYLIKPFTAEVLAAKLEAASRIVLQRTGR